MTARPFEVAVAGVKPGSGKRITRRFGKFESATKFAAEQTRASWIGKDWTISQVETGERWHVGDHYSKVTKVGG